MEQPQQSCHGVTALTLLVPEERMDPSGTRATPQGQDRKMLRGGKDQASRPWSATAATCRDQG